MEIYADYKYYKDKYKGLLDESSFDSLAIKASLEIKNYTNNQAFSDIEEVKECMCILVDKMSENSKFKTTISSEKNDKYSVNYINKTEKELEKEYYTIIQKNLGLLGLLYGGVLNVHKCKYNYL